MAVRRMLGTALVVVVVASGCGGGGGSVDAKACGAALDSYNAALVASDTGTGPNLTNNEETSHQVEVVQACDQSTFEGLLVGNGYDYTKGPDAIAQSDAASVFNAFCSGAPKPNHC